MKQKIANEASRSVKFIMTQGGSVIKRETIQFHDGSTFVEDSLLDAVQTRDVMHGHADAISDDFASPDIEQIANVVNVDIDDEYDLERNCDDHNVDNITSIGPCPDTAVAVAVAATSDGEASDGCVHGNDDTGASTDGACKSDRAGTDTAEAGSVPIVFASPWPVTMGQIVTDGNTFNHSLRNIPNLSDNGSAMILNEVTAISNELDACPMGVVISDPLCMDLMPQHQWYSPRCTDHVPIAHVFALVELQSDSSAASNPPERGPGQHGEPRLVHGCQDAHQKARQEDEHHPRHYEARVIPTLAAQSDVIDANLSTSTRASMKHDADGTGDTCQTSQSSLDSKKKSKGSRLNDIVICGAFTVVALITVALWVFSLRFLPE